MHFKHGEPERVNRAKQRASVTWIIQKAHKNKVPGEFQEPYYKDYEGQEHLKPNVVHRLANADFYCSALANIYGDPNFHTLSHWNIIQALARKGVYIAEPTDVALTETVLIQTTPLKISAHLSVIEAMITLYVREVVVADRVVQAVQRISGHGVDMPCPQDQEEALVLWIDHATQNLQSRIHQHVNGSNEKEQLPIFPRIQDLSDLIDGIGLAALVSYYSPLELPWEEIAVADPPSMADSLYNIGLVIRFCQESLPYNPCLLTKEDIVYMHSAVKQNILGFVAELFFLLELEPVSCVSMASSKTSTKYIQLSSPTGVKPAGAPSVRRSHSINLNENPELKSRPIESRQDIAPMSHHGDSYSRGRESSLSDGQEEFVVQKARGYATLSDMMRQAPQRQQSETSNYNPRAAAKERYNEDTQDDDYGPESSLVRRGSFYGSNQDLPALPPAGLPSRLEGRAHGRSRSRRNSINADESQLTIENFGGSQDNLNYVGRNHDKDPYVHTGRKDTWDPADYRRSSSQARDRSTERKSDLFEPSVDDYGPPGPQAVGERSLAADRDHSAYLKHARLKHDYPDSSSGSSDGSVDAADKSSKATSFAELSKIKEQLSSGINIIYMQPDKDEQQPPPPSSKLTSKPAEKKATFATLPNQTTWKQQSVQSHMGEPRNVQGGDSMEPQVMTSELHDVRLQLEEKRRRIETEKRRMEVKMNKQMQKLGKEAFMQAVVKGARSSTSSSPGDQDSVIDQTSQTAKPSLPLPPVSVQRSPSNSSSDTIAPSDNPTRQKSKMVLSLKDLGTEVTNVSKKWLDSGPPEELRTPDIDAMDYNDCQNSLSHRHYHQPAHSVPPRPPRRSKEYVPVTRLVGPPPDVRRQQSSLYAEPGSCEGGGQWREQPANRRHAPHSSNPYPHCRMTDSLTDIQNDIQMLNQQQSQMQNLMHNGMPIGSSMPSQNQFYLHDQQDSPSRRMWGQHSVSDGYSSMSPATRRPQWGPPARPMLQQGDFSMAQPPAYYPYQMVRNPAQPTHQLPPLNQMGHVPPHNPGGFMLHQPQSLPPGQQPGMYQNGQTYYNPEQYRINQNLGYNNSARGIPMQPNATPFRLHADGVPPAADNRGQYNSLLHGGANSHSNHHQQQPTSQGGPAAQMAARPQQSSKSPSPSPRQLSHAPVAAPSHDDMEPQQIGFIESDGDQSHHHQSRVSDRLKRMSIGSGSKTYRIPNADQGSPTRPTIGTKTYRVPTKKGVPVHDDLDLPQPSFKERSLSPTMPAASPEPDLGLVTEPLLDGAAADKGFYITFEDDSGPKRPKPQLRPKRMSLRKASIPSTPNTTPSREEPPPVPERPKRLGLALSSSRGALMSTSPPSPYSTPSAISRSDITPSSSLSSMGSPVRASAPADNRWSLQRPQRTVSSRASLKDSSAALAPYGGSLSRFNASEDDSDLTENGTVTPQSGRRGDASSGVSLVIGDDLLHENSDISEMEKKKERLMIMSMKRKQQQEETKRKKEFEGEVIREKEKLKLEAKQRKKEEERARRDLILERHKIKKAIEEADKEGRYYKPPAWYFDEGSGTTTPSSKGSLRTRSHRGGSKPRPKTMHEASFTETDSASVKGIPRSVGQRGSTHNISVSKSNEYSKKPERRWGSSTSLSRATGNRGSTGSLRQDPVGSSFNRSYERGHVGRRPSSTVGEPIRKHREAYGSRDGLQQKGLYEVHEAPRRPSLAMDSSRAPPRRSSRSGSTGYGDTGPRKYRSTGNLYGSEHDSMLYHMSEDSGLGRATPPRRAPSPGMARHFPSPSGPGSLPPGLFARRRPGAFDDNASDISASSSNMDYTGPRLFKQPTAKSNRPIILNAVEYCVFPGVVNQNSKQRVLDEIARAECKHFLILFRDLGCQFRAIYSYHPDSEEVYKLFGTGPKVVTDRMFEKFFKYNSGGKCFSQIHTRCLTATIDAFTIHNALWQGKRINLPPKKDMKLVI